MSRLTRTELEFVVEPQVRQFFGPIFFTDSLESPLGNVTASGSFGLVDTGSKKLLVTCYHVWDEFQKARLEKPDLIMCVCPDNKKPVVFATDEPLGRDRILDIATFDMEPLLAAYTPERFYRLKQNPAPKVSRGTPCFSLVFQEI